MITTLPPTVPAVTSEIKSWFLRLLRLVLDASRLVSSPLGLWGAGWIVRFDWVVCGEKMSGKKDLIDWMRESGPRHPGFIASNGRVAGQRTEQSSHFQDQPFLQGHFFSLELLPPKKEFMMLSMLTHYWYYCFTQWHRFLHILLLVRQAPFKICCFQMGIAHKRRGGGVCVCVKAC